MYYLLSPNIILALIVKAAGQRLFTNTKILKGIFDHSGYNWFLLDSLQIRLRHGQLNTVCQNFNSCPSYFVPDIPDFTGMLFSIGVQCFQQALQFWCIRFENFKVLFFDQAFFDI